MPQLSLFDDPAADRSWQVRESARARRLSVRVFADGRVEIVVPPRTAPRAVETFVARHRDWIDRRRAAARRNARPPEPFPPPQLLLSASGEVYRLHLAGGLGPRVAAVARESGVLEVRGRLRGEAHLRAVLRRWLIGHAHRHLGRSLDALAREHGFDYARVAVRRQRSRWGSCSARGTISLNCCLMFQRPEVVRYLLLHELAHTRHMHHGARFWRCVERHCTDYRVLDRELLAGWRRVPAWVFGEASP